MTVEIKIYGESAHDALRELHDLSSGIRPRTTPPGPAILEPEQARAIAEAREIAGVKSNSAVVDEPVGAGTNVSVNGVDTVVKRERGKPSLGRARRTKEEIAEDEAAEDKDMDAAGDAIIAAQISTGENRNGPEDNAETEAQDRADEQAETEAARDGLTLDDLRMVIGAYQRQYGMAAVTADVQTFLGKKMIEVTDDELPAAIETMKQALEKNPLGRAPVGKPAEAKKEPEKPSATKADVIAALMAYALKYDGQNTDTNKMPVTMEDGPKVLTLIFGEGVTSAGKIPESAENYAKAVSGINEMLTKNPFKREAK